MLVCRFGQAPSRPCLGKRLRPRYTRAATKISPGSSGAQKLGQGWFLVGAQACNQGGRGVVWGRIHTPYSEILHTVGAHVSLAFLALESLCTVRRAQKATRVASG